VASIGDTLDLVNEYRTIEAFSQRMTYCTRTLSYSWIRGLLASLLLFSLTSCGASTEAPESVAPAGVSSTADPVSGPGLDAIFDSLAVEEVRSTPPVVDTRSWAQRTLDDMTVAEKAGQLMMPWVLGDFAPEGSASHERILTYIEDQKIGGLIMSVGTPFEVAAKLNDMQAHSDLPLLVAADLETGAGFRMRGAIHMPGTIRDPHAGHDRPRRRD